MATQAPRRLLALLVVIAAGAAGLIAGPLTDEPSDAPPAAAPPPVAEAPAEEIPPAAGAPSGSGLPVSGPVVANAEVRSFGEVVYRGPVDLRETLNGIENGSVERRDTFENREGLLPDRPGGYYAEWVHPTAGIGGAGPQRIVTGARGEIYYTPDHYSSFVEIRE